MGDRREEYERLIAPIEGRMMRAVWRVSRDPAEAEDAFQIALLTIWKRWDRIREHPNPHALVLHICVNAAHDALRSRMRQNKRLLHNAVPPDIPDAVAFGPEHLIQGEQKADVLRAIAQLAKNQARAILMHAVEEMPYVDIAAVMNCREATVRKHVARARAKLRLLLSHLFPGVHKEESKHARQACQ